MMLNISLQMAVFMTVTFALAPPMVNSLSMTGGATRIRTTRHPFGTTAATTRFSATLLPTEGGIAILEEGKDRVTATINHTKAVAPPSSTKTRRQYFAQIGSAIALGSAAAGGFPFPAMADVTSKLASTAALRSVKRAAKELEDMELLVTTGDYEGVKAAIRVPPFTEVRKNCVVLIKGGEDAGEELSGSLERTYADFKVHIEALDSAASLGIRGRKDVEMSASFGDSVKSLNEFVAVAEKAAGVPIQYADE